MARIANIVFPHSTLKYTNLTAQLMIEIFQALPSDSKIVSIGSLFNQAADYITIESNSFIDHNPTTFIPEISCIFNMSYTHLVSLDMSAALVAYAPCTCGVCYQCLTSLPAVATPPPTPPPPPSAWAQSISSSSGTSASFNLPNNYIISTSGLIDKRKELAPFCDPQWETYDSGFSTYQYCSKCNKKQDNHE